MNLELISMLVFFAILGILLYRDRKNVEFHSGLIIRRWKGGLESIDSFVKKHTKIIKFSGYVAVGLGFLVSLCGIGLLIYSMTKMLPGIQLILPTAAGYKYPGPIIGVPFWYWLIAIFVIMFSHETMHGVFARAAKVPLKNYGILLFFVLPIGAFVDPNMKRVQKLKTGKKLPFLAAGSFGNFVVALIFTILALIFIGIISNQTIYASVIEPKGVVFNETIDGYPAHYANLTGMIKSIDGIEIKTTEDLLRILNNTESGKEIEIITNVSTYKIKTVSRLDNQSGSFIGISSPMTLFYPEDWVVVISNLFSWIVLLNIGIGFANLLPWKPFDGGLMAEEVLTKYFKKNGKLMSNVLTAFTFAIVLFSLFGIKIIQAIA